MLIGTARIPPKADAVRHRDGSVPDVDRDVTALAWDLTADQAASGSYGRCVDCRRVIGAEHLDAFPTTRRCLPCLTGEH